MERDKRIRKKTKYLKIIIFILIVLQLLLIDLKAYEIIVMSWFYVLLPIIIPTIVVGIWLIVMIVLSVYMVKKHNKETLRKKNREV